MHENRIDLSRFENSSFRRGRSILIEGFWFVANWLFVRSTLPGSLHRRVILRWFGAKIGRGVAIKPGVRVKFPWRLAIGDNAWVGEDVWIDNLASVAIGANACVSQGAYLCTGNHDWSRAAFDLVVKPITIEAGAWIAARAVVGPGVTIGAGAVLTLGSLATRNLEAWTIYEGVPATPVKKRVITDTDASDGTVLRRRKSAAS
jgi:putative colanic acid biosynthesis acetyltransferase WcaF